MMQGKSNKLICRALDLAEPTVKNHVSAILKALEVTTAPRRCSQSRRWAGSCRTPVNDRLVRSALPARRVCSRRDMMARSVMGLTGLCSR